MLLSITVLDAFYNDIKCCFYNSLRLHIRCVFFNRSNTKGNKLIYIFTTYAELLDK